MGNALALEAQSRSDRDSRICPTNSRSCFITSERRLKRPPVKLSTSDVDKTFRDMISTVSELGLVLSRASNGNHCRRTRHDVYRAFEVNFNSQVHSPEEPRRVISGIVKGHYRAIILGPPDYMRCTVLKPCS